MLRHVVYASLLHFGVETAGQKGPHAKDDRVEIHHEGPFLCIADDGSLPRLCENARDWGPDCVRSGIGEDLADRRGKISRIEPREHLMTF